MVSVMASRVVPASGEVRVRSCLRMALKSVDLPTLGCPRMRMVFGVSRSGSGLV